MSLLARSLDILQGDTTMYLGYLLPVIVPLKSKLQQLKYDGLKFCDPSDNSILNGVQDRFQALFNRFYLINAACLHSKFKFDWITEQSEKDPCMQRIERLLNLNIIYTKKNQREERSS
ncbi:uncharacterized protein LOC117173288 [Belonocnema kinseyi]|uniref:uncharacterized protein LOC117173288 n=1 Tax=Belonocnema kinseyi TaxID=2817044 RepID=UPI00143D15A1|nr:uncharacterized protein LOC117173288 [Belonocnema kinseyi]